MHPSIKDIGAMIPYCRKKTNKREVRKTGMIHHRLLLSKKRKLQAIKRIINVLKFTSVI
jgi:hypothetical protein